MIGPQIDWNSETRTLTTFYPRERQGKRQRKAGESRNAPRPQPTLNCVLTKPDHGAPNRPADNPNPEASVHETHHTIVGNTRASSSNTVGPLLCGSPPLPGKKRKTNDATNAPRVAPPIPTRHSLKKPSRTPTLFCRSASQYTPPWKWSACSMYGWSLVRTLTAAVPLSSVEKGSA